MRTVAVVDGNSLIHRAFHALPPSMTAPDGRPTNAAFGFLSMLVKLIGDYKPDGVVVAFDCGKPAFRTQALAQYKVHRPPTPQDLRAQFPMVKRLLQAIEIPIVEVEGWEGDDVLGTLATRGREQGVQVLLVTGDRDVFQLVGGGVRVLTTRKGITDIVEYGPEEVLDRYGVTPAQVPDYLGLKGDTSDNIPGVPGVGEKTAAKLLQQYGTLEEVIEHAGEIPGKLGENLRAHVGEALASRTVATIACDVPIDLDIANVAFGAFEPSTVAAALGELRFTSMLDRVLAIRRPGAAEGAAREGTHGLEAPAEAPAQDGAVPSGPAITRGVEAATLARDWARAAQAWLGVSTDEGAGGSLFAEELELAIAKEGRAALVSGDEVPNAFAALWATGKIAASDEKALMQLSCPPDEALPCDEAALAVSADRLFDTCVAAYLLESNRSSYDLPSLAADYLGSPLPEPSDELPMSILRAQAVERLAHVLEARLADDGSLEVMRTIEMPLVAVLARMERVGVGIDCSVLADLSAKAELAIEELRGEIHKFAGVEFAIDSPKQLAEVLFETLGLPAQKRTKTGFSTDASVLAALADIHPIAAKIVSYRELTKLKSTYLDALPRLLGEDGRLHTSFNQTVAATGRLSSSNPNLQNIPVRTEYGRRIRAAFVPAVAGDLIVSADYSQIELRILAHLSQDAGLIEAFTGGMDFHLATAARVFGVDPEQVEPGMRARAKAVNFGIVYGQSAHGLADSLKIGRTDAQQMIDRYYAAYPGVRVYLDETVARAHRDGFAQTMFGRKRRIPELASSNYNLRSFGERTAMNHPMQGSAADIMKLAMIEVDRRLREDGFRSRMVLQVHDELVFEAPGDEVERLSAMACEAMAGVARLSVPLEVSVAAGRDWASAK